MTEYTLIGEIEDPNSPTRYRDLSFEIKDNKNEHFFICDNCFKIFRTRSLHHLEKCRLEWPYQDVILVKSNPKTKIRIYRIDKERDIINKRIINAIVRLGGFSKEEQNLGLPISTNGLLKTHILHSLDISNIITLCFFIIRKLSLIS